MGYKAKLELSLPSARLEFSNLPGEKLLRAEFFARNFTDRERAQLCAVPLIMATSRPEDLECLLEEWEFVPILTNLVGVHCASYILTELETVRNELVKEEAAHFACLDNTDVDTYELLTNWGFYLTVYR